MHLYSLHPYPFWQPSIVSRDHFSIGVWQLFRLASDNFFGEPPMNFTANFRLPFQLVIASEYFQK